MENESINKRWWISMSINNWFGKLHLKSEEINPNSDKKNWDNILYFDKEEDAQNFLRELMLFIEEKYDRAKIEGWFNNKY